MQYQRLGDWLVREGVITVDQLEEAIATQSSRPQRLGKVIVDLGFATEEQITTCLAAQYEIPLASLEKLRCQKDALAMMPPTFALARSVLPYKVTDFELHCVISDPLDIPATDEIARAAGKRMVLSLATPTEVWNAIVKAYKLPKSAMKTTEPEAPKREPKLTDDCDRRELLFRLRDTNTDTTLWEKFAGGSQ